MPVAYLILYLSQRLKNWELRERKKARDYAKDTEREDERRREMVRGLGGVQLNFELLVYTLFMYMYILVLPLNQWNSLNLYMTIFILHFKYEIHCH